MPKISILIPAYNVENYIDECLESVLNQSLSDIEIICVDDASTDDTLSILRNYEEKDKRVKIYFHTENKGQSCGRNLALSHATGEYVYMLDADDKIVPGALEELYEICHSNELDVVGFETHQFMDDDELMDKLPAKMISYDDMGVMNGAKALSYCMSRDVFSLSVPTFMMRKEYLDEIGLLFVQGILHEDVGYIFELICRAGKIRFLHKVYFERRVRENSTMTTEFTDRNIEGYLKSFLRSFEIEDELRKMYHEDKTFERAVRKWRRDIYGRIRQLYFATEESIYWQCGGNVDENVRRMFQMIKLGAIGKGQAEDILAGKMISNNVTEVYLCGMGQYAERMIGVMSALDIIVKGILVLEKKTNSFRGFPVIQISEAKKIDVPIILSVSRYYADEYMEALENKAENGALEIEKVIKVNF